MSQGGGQSFLLCIGVRMGIRFFFKLRSSAVSVEHGSQLEYNCIYYIIFNCTESGEEQTFAVFADLNTQYLLIH